MVIDMPKSMKVMFEVTLPHRFSIETRNDNNVIQIDEYERRDEHSFLVKRSGVPCGSVSEDYAAQQYVIATRAISQLSYKYVTGVYTGRTADENSYEKRFGKGE